MAELPKADTHAQEEPALQTTPQRKRRIDSDNQPPTKRARLTRENLTRFNKMGKDHKGSKRASTHHGSTTESSSTSKSLSTTASGFDIQAYKNGLLDPSRSKPPSNLEDIYKRLARSRTTASPPESVYEEYVDRVEGAPNEATMVYQVGGKLLKEYPGKGYKKVFNQAFTGYPKDVGFNNGLSAPQPDFVEGIEMRDYHPFPVDERVPGAVLYKDDRRSVTLPHIAGEWKGPDGSMAEATLQSSYDGAALVFARNQALSRMSKPDPPGHASVTTFTTNGTNLNFHAHYATQAEDGTLEYHQYPVKSMNLVNSHQEFKDAHRGLRNEQDHARTQSYALKDQLKEHWKQHHSSLHPIAEGTQPLDTYKEDDYEIVGHQPMPPTSSKHHGNKTHSSHSHHSHHSHSHHSHSSHGHSSNSGHKRKASHSSGSSSSSSQHRRHRSYWTRDSKTGRYFHGHSNGDISWLDDDEHDDD